jgi:hypothetical protein
MPGNRPSLSRPAAKPSWFGKERPKRFMGEEFEPSAFPINFLANTDFSK